MGTAAGCSSGSFHTSGQIRRQRGWRQDPLYSDSLPLAIPHLLFSSPFPSSKPSGIFLPVLLQTYDLFFSLTVHIMLLVYVFSEPSIWCWITTGVLFPEEDCFLRAQIPSAFSSLCRAEASCFFPHPLCHVHCCLPSLAHVSAVTLVGIYGSHVGGNLWV